MSDRTEASQVLRLEGPEFGRAVVRAANAEVLRITLFSVVVVVAQMALRISIVVVSASTMHVPLVDTHGVAVVVRVQVQQETTRSRAETAVADQVGKALPQV